MWMDVKEKLISGNIFVELAFLKFQNFVTARMFTSKSN